MGSYFISAIMIGDAEGDRPLLQRHVFNRRHQHSALVLRMRSAAPEELAGLDDIGIDPTFVVAVLCFQAQRAAIRKE